MTQPEASERRRSWGKIVALGCGGLAVIGVLVVVGILVVVIGAVKRSDVYRQAMQQAQESPAAVAALGEPIEAGWWVSGSVQTSGAAGTARLSIPVSGPQGEGKLMGEAVKTAGTWGFTQLRLAVEGSQPIDLLAADATAAEASPAAAPLAATAPTPALPAAASAAGVFSIHAERRYSYADNPLYTEVTLNGELVNIFTSDTWEPLPITRGWNRLTMTTTAQAPANQENGLLFRFGPMFEDEESGRSSMAPVLWFLRNDSDWQLEDSRFRHPLGPEVTTVRHDYELYFAGLDLEGRELEAGDFVLQGAAKYTYQSSPVTATVVVNGTTLTSFTLEQRQVVITSLLVEGKNEIRLISKRVPNVLVDNDILFSVAGPAEWNVARNEYVMKPIVEFSAMQGWQRDEETAQLVNPAAPEADAIERVVPFVLKGAPAAGG
jgi:hypothetical protein